MMSILLLVFSYLLSRFIFTLMIHVFYGCLLCLLVRLLPVYYVYFKDSSFIYIFFFVPTCNFLICLQGFYCLLLMGFYICLFFLSFFPFLIFFFFCLCLWKYRSLLSHFLSLSSLHLFFSENSFVILFSLLFRSFSFSFPTSSLSFAPFFSTQGHFFLFTGREKKKNIAYAENKYIFLIQTQPSGQRELISNARQCHLEQ